MADWVPGPVTVAIAALTAGLVVGGFAGTTVAATQIVTDCRTISEPGAYELSGDLDGPADDSCLRIEASNVTLDGNGYSIDAGDRENRTGTGVLVAPGADSDQVRNVTVQNLQVTHWQTGIAYREVTGSTIRNVTASENGNGLVLTDSSAITVRNTTADDNEDGVLTRDVIDSTFQNVIARGNAGTGLYTSNDFEGNRLEDTTAAENGDDGIRVGPAWNTVFENTTTSANIGDGLVMLDTGRIQVQGLDASSNGGAGVDLTAVAGARFENVTARSNAEAAYSAVESRNVTVRALAVGPEGTLSLTAGSARISTVDSPPSPPEGYALLGPSVNVSRAEDGPGRPVVSLTTTEQTQTQPTLWQYDEGEWVELTGVQFDSSESSLSATVGNGIIAVLVPTAEPDTAPAENETVS